MLKVQKAKIKNRISHNLLNMNILEVGYAVPFDIFIKKAGGFVVIVKAGTLITKKIYTMLEKQDAVYTSKQDKVKHKLSCETLQYYVEYNKENLEQSLKFLYEINEKLFSDFLNTKDNIFDLPCVKALVKSIIILVKQHKHYLKDTMSYFSNEHILADHSLHVAIYAINLGNLLHYDDIELQQLGLAGLLHDLGIKKINESITAKHSKLTLDELETVHQHSKYSTDIAKQNFIHDPYVIDAIMHHHENHDGSGYPDHLSGNDISNFASILSISDVFDALTNERPYREKMSTFDALTLMMKDSQMVNKFNRKYIKVFLKSLV